MSQQKLLKSVVAQLDSLGGSEKQFTDALRIYEVQHSTLDGGYLADWAERLSVRELWERLQEEAKPIT